MSDEFVSKINAPLDWSVIKERAAQFVINHKNDKSEESQKQVFWYEFFNIFGVSSQQVGSFEAHVKKIDGSNGSIDYFWPGILIIEHKSRGKNLDEALQQAIDYTAHLTSEEFPKYLIVSDFAIIRLVDLRNYDRSYDIELDKLVDNIELFSFIAGYNNTKIAGQHPVNIKAAETMGLLYDMLKDSHYPEDQIDKYLVRLVFCLFSEDAFIFSEKNIFREYIGAYSAQDGSNTGSVIDTIFNLLNTPNERRQTSISEQLNKFPYVNGGLFAERLETAYFNEKMLKCIMEASRLNWKEISPAIFGSLFQCVMDPEMRRELGAHYTSEENILKAINPLFMDDLRSEFNSIRNDKVALKSFITKLSQIKILDPACGCGNFLIISFRELRSLEIEVMEALYGESAINRASRITVDNFYGIEIESFPAQIAQIAMWLMEHLMNLKRMEKFGRCDSIIPLKSHANIYHGNALTKDWSELVSPDELTYIVGNPPFVGASLMSAEQKKEAVDIFGKIRLANSIDFVGAWYHKAASYIQGTNIRCAFVSTNSICQGEQVAPLWGKIINEYGCKIDFAYRTFKWNNEARGKAAVHCIIVGFSKKNVQTHKFIVYEDGTRLEVDVINPYLVNAVDILVESRVTPICKSPKVTKGNQPSDDGNLVISIDEYDELLQKYPGIEKYIRKYVSGVDFINNQYRYCLWLNDNDRGWTDYKPIMERIEKVREFRLGSTAKPTRDKAATPHLFFSPTQPTNNYLVIPRVSSENRDYIPIGFVTPDIIASDAVSVVHDATLFHFGILTSAMHMAWMRAVAGRLKSDYRYSGGVVYNTFPWPEVSEEQIEKIEKLAKAILDIRALYPNDSYAKLYNRNSMPRELSIAHHNLDRAVDKLYTDKVLYSDKDRLPILFSKYATLKRGGESLDKY